MCQNYYAVSFVAAADKEMGRVGERERERERVDRRRLYFDVRAGSAAS